MPRTKNKPWNTIIKLKNEEEFHLWLCRNKHTLSGGGSTETKKHICKQILNCKERNCPFQYRVVYPLGTEEVYLQTFTTHVHDSNTSQDLQTKSVKFTSQVKDIIDPMIVQGK